MDFNATKLFIAVVQAGSFSAASERTGVPISTLSRKINDLERALRVQLLERSRQGVKPTYKGQQFFEQSRQGLELLEEAQKNVQSAHKLQGKLRISVPPDFPLWWDLLTAFQQRYPDIKIFCHASERVIDLFEDGIDVALRMGDLHTEDVIARPVMTVKALFVASPELLASRGTPQTLAELARFPVTGWESLNHGFFEWGTGPEKVKYEPFFSSNNVRGLCHYAVSGMGVSQLLDFLAKPYLESGLLVELLPDLPKQTLPLHLVYARHKHPSAIVMAYLDFCSEWIAKHTF
ncbi:LysR family transcriptional regulator [Chimaeribacter californicus]|uniref:LysR family transcriptional regulator n=1 Tax=Chimaeribacter californicus TaxID=2060067 RepID=A0A2N5ECD2_9GAMM|nr:LysR family transcriptional regulator [Chimaeribacter californicus]PLR39754.1 LysR family transcriptional regulator [Chimaeribacter californicus]